MNNQEELLMKLMSVGEKESEVTLKNFNVYGIFVSDYIYFMRPMNVEEDDEVVFLWLKIDRDIMNHYLQDEDRERVNKIFDSNKETIFMTSESEFWNDLTINGCVEEFNEPLYQRLVKGINVRTLEKQNGMTWDRGSIIIKGEDKAFVGMNDDLKSRVALGLKRYISTPIFGYLASIFYNNELEEDKHYAVIECKECGCAEIFHVFEIANGFASHDYCRTCSSSNYEDLSCVPFSETFSINLYSKLTSLFEKYIHMEKEPPEKLLYELKKYSNLDHQIEIGVTIDYLRGYLKEKFEPELFKLRAQFIDMENQVKLNSSGLDELMIHKDKFSNLQSLQATTDISETFESIGLISSEKYFDIHFPHPNKHKSNSDEEFIDFNKLDRMSINSLVNLYKDIFDLTGNHWFISNFSKVLKKAPVIEDCIKDELYGENLLQKTLKYSKGTQFYNIIEKTFDTKIRNAIAHPGRYIDFINDEVTIYNKGEVIAKYAISEFMNRIYDLINFHLELTHMKYRLGIYEDRSSIMTGGVISLQPEFFTDADDKDITVLIVNQTYPFEEYMPELGWWADNLIIDVVEEDNNIGLKLSIPRNISKYGDSPELRTDIYGLSPYITQWIKEALDKGEIHIMHRICHLPVDLREGDDDFPWIPVEIPCYPLEEEVEYFFKSITTSGKFNVSEELESKFLRILQKNDV